MSENQKSKFIPILLVLIVLAVATGLGSYMIIKNRTNEPNIGGVNTNAPKTEIWKTYTNNKYGYKFDYPSKIVLSPDSVDDAIDFWGNDQSDFLSVAIVNNVFSLDAWLKDNPDKIIVQKTKIANYDAYITQQDTSSYNDRMALFLKDSQLFTIGTKLPDADFNRMLKSFKFENK